MFSYYGSKSKIIDLYPAPRFDRIIEPFAGSARYSLKYFDRDVLLVDKYPVIVEIWQWLQHASPADILGLPDVNHKESIVDFDIPDEAKNLIGFCINRGSSSPANIAQNFNNWNDDRRTIADNLFKIRHWEIRQSSYENLINESATWFIDPPYQWGGHHYKFGNDKIDFSYLAEWCKSRNGQAIVCENTKADWLPFLKIKQTTGAYSTTTEAMWSNYPHPYQTVQLDLFTI